METSRRTWACVFIRDVQRTGTPGDEVAYNVSVDALRDRQIGVVANESNRTAQAGKIEPIAHMSAGHGYAASSKLAEERPFENEREHEDVELRAEGRDELRPLLLRAADDKCRADEQDSRPTLLAGPTCRRPCRP
jgi:hypothetical protein